MQTSEQWRPTGWAAAIGAVLGMPYCKRTCAEIDAEEILAPCVWKYGARKHGRLLAELRPEWDLSYSAPLPPGRVLKRRARATVWRCQFLIATAGKPPRTAPGSTSRMTPPLAAICARAPTVR